MTTLKTNSQVVPIQKIENLVKLEAEAKKLKKQIEIYRTELLALTQTLDVYQLKTGKYTLYRAKRVTPQVVNFKTLKSQLEAQNIPYETEERFTPQMQVLFRELTKQGKSLDGLDIQETEYISIRTKDEDKS